MNDSRTSMNQEKAEVVSPSQPFKTSGIDMSVSNGTKGSDVMTGRRDDNLSTNNSNLNSEQNQWQNSNNYNMNSEKNIMYNSNNNINNNYVEGEKQNYELRNLEHIQKLKEKQMKKEEERLQQEEKEKRKREKLKNQILKEAAKNRSAREGLENSNNNNNNNFESASQHSNQKRQSSKTQQHFSKGEKEAKINSVSNSNSDFNMQRQQELGESKGDLQSDGAYQPNSINDRQEQMMENFDPEKEQKKKLQNYYRSRYVTFIKALSENQKQEKQMAQMEKQKQEDKIIKLQQEMGINKVSSQFLEMTQAQKLRKQALNEQSNLQQERCNSLQVMKTPQEIKENQQQLLDQQREHIEGLKQKKIQEQQKQEDKLKKQQDLQEKMKQFVLVNVKKQIENGNWFVQDAKNSTQQQKKNSKEKQSENLKGLDLQVPVQQDQNKQEKEQAYNTVNLGAIQQEQEKQGKQQQTPSKVQKLKLPQIDQQQNSNIAEVSTENDDGEDIGSPEDSTQPKEKKQLRSYPFITDLQAWQQKQRIPAETKIFIVIGGYADLKRALKGRGWLENPDPFSPCFDLQWTLQARDIDYDNLRDFQLVNHYQKNNEITTKIGLCQNIRNLIWFNNVDVDTFYPRCFDLNDPEDVQNFQQDFQTTQAESVLKQYLRLFKEQNIVQMEKIKPQAIIALQVCQRQVRDLDDIIDDNGSDILNLVTDQEWNILTEGQMNMNALQIQKHEQFLAKINQNKKSQKQKRLKSAQVRQNTEQIDNDQEKQPEEGKEQEGEDDDETKGMDQFTQQVYNMLENIEEQYPQSIINGEMNIWIIKPAGLSRGRGITVHNNLLEIQDHVKSKESQWVIQKYIENPLIIQKQKFDIRQWVMVTDLNPLTIWFYDECYIRFTVDQYNGEDLSNQFTHLTNNSIAQHSQNFDQIYDDITAQGNMYFQEQFQKHLQNLEGRDIFQEEVQPAMKKAVIYSLESCQDAVENRKNSHEMFGYDFMVDDQYNVWLIEVNSSPAMDYSTDVTERLVKETLQDLPKVIVDYNFAKKKKGLDTGKWIKIFQGETVAVKSTNMGLNLVCEGKAIKTKKNNNSSNNNAVKINNISLN